MALVWIYFIVKERSLYIILESVMIPGEELNGVCRVYMHALNVTTGV